ncbi:uncharacterized protein LOC132285009 isoform X2 [Cornus florida]|uniref:uncharacterized protein LOC132285009 isoform X2 n=1 Tax=Cornus florida TaxID=4283 RepID=UPI00289F4AC5|nr:uncharacterized protein LOC132285009 isoform X2 [Cornus florida]
METVIGVEANDDANFEDGTVADPVVYKLVRVEGDGRLVPATDDEVMEVEDLLEDDKSEMPFAADTGQTVGCTSNNGFPSGKTRLEGTLQSDNPEADVAKSNAQLDTGIGSGKLNARLEEVVPSSALSSHGSQIDQSGTAGECSIPPGEPTESGRSTGAVGTNLKPDFSKLQGEICLENLSVKELQETFKATFGRETSVKDKQWLKRRIAMGLTNSCDVTTTTFVIKDNKVVKKGKEGNCEAVVGTLAKDSVVGAMNEDCRSSPISHNNQTSNLINVSGKRTRNPSLEDDSISDELHVEQKAAKRVRKPTKRYIEELSEVESGEYSGKLISSVKSSGHGQSSPRSHVSPVQYVRSDVRPVVTRQDSLGGSGVQVPYVSRLRRGRPRENYMALMKLQPSGMRMDMAAKLVKKAIGVRGPRPNNERGNGLFKARLAPGWIQQPLMTELKKDKEYLERKTAELEKDVELKQMTSCGDNSDDNVKTVPTAKGGMRRKHHRPWTLSEVVKLVDGVARYGAGRWSEIKRLAFASYTYRTSVDLKDKWRNLLRASFAQVPAEKDMQNSRKHASMPIPAPILSRVRELAEMQAEVEPHLSSGKFVGCSGRSVNEARPGFL